MAKNISQIRSGNGAIRAIGNPCGNVGTQNQPSWGERTPKPQNLNPAPPTGPVQSGKDTAATPMKDNPAENSTSTSGAGAESPNDVGQEDRS